VVDALVAEDVDVCLEVDALVVLVGDIVTFVVVEAFEEVDCEELVGDTVLDVVTDETFVKYVETELGNSFAYWKLMPPPGLTIARFGSCFTKGSSNVITFSKGRLRASDL